MGGHWNGEIVAHKPCNHSIKNDPRIALSNKLKVTGLYLNGWQIAKVSSNEIPHRILTTAGFDEASL